MLLFLTNKAHMEDVFINMFAPYRQLGEIFTLTV